MSRRTKILLDRDVVERLHEESRPRGISFQEALNGAVRKGLMRPQQAMFCVEPFSVGLRADLSYDSVSTLLEIS